jgi:arylsulfatase A-like enzyme
VIVIVLLFLANPDPLTAKEPSAQPYNIVLVIADDLGYGDLGCYGSQDIKTPHIDSLAGSGVRFTSAYATASVCSPSRAGLITGRYQQRFGHEDNTGTPAYQPEHVGLPVDEATMGTVLGQCGYTTGMIGKWHLGVDRKYHPLERGFDEFFGFLTGARGYFDTRKLRSRNPLMRGMRAVREEEYLTDAFTREAVAFISKHKNEPFFLTVSYNAIHKPHEAPEKYIRRVDGVEGDFRKTYVAMAIALDDGVGRIVSALEANGLSDRTMIAFVSDNGARSEIAKDTPFRGGKSEHNEGGIRIPYIISAPGLIEEGKQYSAPVSSLDLLPTFLSLSGELASSDTPSKPLDGENLLPYLRDERSGEPHQFLFWRRHQDRAARSGQWKFLKTGDGPAELYDLNSDPGERNSVAHIKPEKLKELSQAHAEWEEKLMVPKWNWKALSDQKSRAAGKRDPHPASYIEGFPLE